MARKDPFNESVGQRLARARKLVGLDRREAAEALGLAYETYGGYERGWNTFPISLLPKASALLGRPATYFLGMPSDSELTEDEFALLAAYRSIDNMAYRETSLELVQGLAERSKT